jgi:hypothetical protein
MPDWARSKAIGLSRSRISRPELWELEGETPPTELGDCGEGCPTGPLAIRYELDFDQIAQDDSALRR